jgi:hypothetical protein
MFAAFYDEHKDKEGSSWGEYDGDYDHSDDKGKAGH